MKKVLRFVPLMILCLVLALCWPLQASAASESDLTFTLNADGESYSVTGCDTFASGEMVIPSTYHGYPVTGIGEDAFYDCDSLTSVTIPDSVTSIGDYAFYDCRSLTSVIIPDGITSVGWSAFRECSNLTYNIYDNAKYLGNTTNPYVLLVDTKSYFITSCNIHDNTKVIHSSAFSSQYDLTSIIIPNSVVSIGEGAFSYCDNLTSVTIGTGITNTGVSVFKGCTGLTRITIPDSVTSIDDGAFEGCIGLTSVTFGNGVTSIGNKAFRNCTSLTSVTIPDNVMNIGESVFSGCSGLESMTIPFVGDIRRTETDIYHYPLGYFFGTDSYAGGIITLQYFSTDSGRSSGAFYYIPENLKTVTVTGGNILRSAFSNCNNLTNINLPDDITGIGDFAFENCTGITSIMIPGSVTSIGSDAFKNCSSLTSITLPKFLDNVGSFSGCTSLTSIIIPDGVMYLGEFAFENCVNLTSITLPDSLLYIIYAFDGCESLRDVYYAGTQEQWDSIWISSGNDALLSATLHTKGTLQVQEDGNLLLLGSTEMEELEVLDGQVLDLNGNVLTVDSLASFGQIIDSVGGGGLIVENIEITGNEWLPIQDESGCYRFYEHETESLGTKTEGSSTVFGFTLDFADSAAYDLLAESEDVQITVTLTVGENSQTYAFSRELVAQYVALVAKYPTLRPYMKLTVRGMDTLAEGTAVTVTPTITAIGGKIQVNGESMQYIA